MTSPASMEGAHTRERLLRAAIDLIPEVGWGGVTTRKIAAHAGVRPGVVHYHFSSVPNLLADAAVEATRAALTEARAALDAAGDVTSALTVLLASLESYADDDPTALLLAESFLAATRDERLRQRLRDLLRGFRAEVAAWLRGHGHEADADATAAALVAALDGLLLHRAVDPDMPLDPLRRPLGRLVAATAPRPQP